jgi:hypothetical protein
METKEMLPLKERLLQAIHQVLKDSKADLTEKMEKVIRKSVRRIVKKTARQLTG